MNRNYGLCVETREMSGDWGELRLIGKTRKIQKKTTLLWVNNKKDVVLPRLFNLPRLPVNTVVLPTPDFSLVSTDHP